MESHISLFANDTHALDWENEVLLQKIPFQADHPGSVAEWVS